MNVSGHLNHWKKQLPPHPSWPCPRQTTPFKWKQMVQVLDWERYWHKKKTIDGTLSPSSWNPDLRQNAITTLQTWKLMRSFLPYKNGITICWEQNTPLKSWQTTKICYISNDLMISLDDRHAGNNSFRNTILPSSTDQDIQTLPILCPGGQTLRREWRTTINPKSSSLITFLHHHHTWITKELLCAPSTCKTVEIGQFRGCWAPSCSEDDWVNGERIATQKGKICSQGVDYRKLKLETKRQHAVPQKSPLYSKRRKDPRDHHTAKPQSPPHRSPQNKKDKRLDLS